MQPRIAIPADTLTEATNIINERNAAFAPRPLIEAVLKSGGVPVIFPSVATSLTGLSLPAVRTSTQPSLTKNRTSNWGPPT